MYPLLERYKTGETKVVGDDMKSEEQKIIEYLTDKGFTNSVIGRIQLPTSSEVGDPYAMRNVGVTVASVMAQYIKTRTQSKEIEEAIEYINSLQIDSWNKSYYADCMHKLHYILQEANDGKKVDLSTGSPYCTFYECPNCKELFDDESKYCNHCGQKLVWPEQQEGTKEEVVVYNKERPKDYRGGVDRLREW